MDVREKLVELIFKSLCRHIHKSCKLAENIADDLIADGVTVQEASDRNVRESVYADGGMDILACPRCGSGEYLTNADGNRNAFCGQCGQALDWTEPEVVRYCNVCGAPSIECCCPNCGARMET